MHYENQATLFIRMLTEAYEAHLSRRASELSHQHRASAVRFQNRQISTLNEFLRGMELLDTDHLTAPDPQTNGPDDHAQRKGWRMQPG